LADGIAQPVIFIYIEAALAGILVETEKVFTISHFREVVVLKGRRRVIQLQEWALHKVGASGTAHWAVMTLIQEVTVKVGLPNGRAL
jgi:hypothetical protein